MDNLGNILPDVLTIITTSATVALFAAITALILLVVSSVLRTNSLK